MNKTNYRKLIKSIIINLEASFKYISSIASGNHFRNDKFIDKFIFDFKTVYEFDSSIYINLNVDTKNLSYNEFILFDHSLRDIEYLILKKYEINMYFVNPNKTRTVSENIYYNKIKIY